MFEHSVAFLVESSQAISDSLEATFPMQEVLKQEKNQN